MIRECRYIPKGVHCKDMNCKACGFNPHEDQLRKNYVKKFGLTINKEGCKQLIITKDKRRRISTS